ncbi:hypothetical protein NPX79_02905 [Spiroplasma endosymbiont of Anurida maritima]|uniref:hypothetical protein n=1 Tax=Spiroplasma endosymbiont of Anurida maritima TaxID=2967972 RepID=UPI0036D3ECE5
MTGKINELKNKMYKNTHPENVTVTYTQDFNVEEERHKKMHDKLTGRRRLNTSLIDDFADETIISKRDELSSKKKRKWKLFNK